MRKQRGPGSVGALRRAESLEGFILTNVNVKSYANKHDLVGERLHRSTTRGLTAACKTPGAL
jgi:hypothetical protein